MTEMPTGQTKIVVFINQLNKLKRKIVEVIHFKDYIQSLKTKKKKQHRLL